MTVYRNTRPSSSRRVRTPGDDVVDAVVDELGVFAPDLAIRLLVERRCDERGVDRPRPHVLRARLALRRRYAREGDEPRARLVVDHCPVDLPVRSHSDHDPERPTLPFASLIVVEPGGRILASALGIGRPDATATHRVLAQAAAALHGTDAPAVLAGTACPGDWPVLERLIGRRLVVRTRLPLGAEARRVLGRTLAGIELRPRSWRRTDAAGRAIDDVDLESAGAALQASVDLHNRGRHSPACLGLRGLRAIIPTAT